MKRRGDTFPLADPRVLERLGRGNSLGRVYGQHRVDEVLCLWRDRIPLGRRVLGGKIKISTLIMGRVEAVGQNMAQNIVPVYVMDIYAKFKQNPKQLFREKRPKVVTLTSTKSMLHCITLNVNKSFGAVFFEIHVLEFVQTWHRSP